MKTLVTGGGGFLGRHLVQRLLERGDEVTVLARGDYPDLAESGVRLIRCDLQDGPRVRAACAGIDVVFHVAARAGLGGPYHDYHQANVLGTRHIIDGCRAHGVGKLIYTSTPSVVISTGDIRDGDESLPYAPDPLSSYQRSKIAAERLVLAAHRPGVLVTAALRPHAIWGPGDTQLLPRLIAAAHAGKLRRIGAGKNRISVTYVTTAADAHLQAAGSDAAGGKAYFINEVEHVNLWDWLNRILRALGVAPVERSLPAAVAYALGTGVEYFHRAWPRAGEPRLTRYLVALLARDHYFRVDRAIRDFGFHSPTGADVAMQRALAYYQQGISR
jgi:nucleoside-diphosphate-sugar epimerase